MQLIPPIGEGRIRREAKGNVVTEIDNKHLILRITGTGECQSRVYNIVALGLHASAVIHKNADCDRDIFVSEVLDLLQYAVLINMKIVFAKSGNERVMVVKNGCAQNYDIGIKFESIFVICVVMRR